MICAVSLYQHLQGSFDKLKLLRAGFFRSVKYKAVLEILEAIHGRDGPHDLFGLDCMRLLVADVCNPTSVRDEETSVGDINWR